MKLDSYWLDTAPAMTFACEGPADGQADVAVIGGGFTGLSAALALARRGASVVVLDAGRIGGGASGRNGGQCNTGVAQVMRRCARNSASSVRKGVIARMRRLSIPSSV